VSARQRALAVCLAVAALDQASKAAVSASLHLGKSADLPLGFQLTHTENRGVAFGFLGGGGAPVVVVTLVALGLVLGWFWRNPARPGLWLATGLIAGGALGNMIDRARIGAVTDFLDPPLWPAFNVADVGITAGAAILVLVTLAPERSPP
jgi:signal peptidase II